MKIGIDARLIHETGVGRYIQNLIRELGVVDKKNSYIAFARKKIALPNDQWTFRNTDIPWHSVREQIEMPRILGSEHLDLVHIPYHNPPIFYPGNMIITIHDLTILHFDTGRATTLPMPLYKLKRLGYWAELALGLRKAKKIIAVSETTKQGIIEHFHINPEKITVTYEGADVKKSNNTRIIKEPYVLYVGNAYPHKNLETLLRAFGRLFQGHPLQSKEWPYVKLVLATPDDYFSKRLKINNNTLMVHNPNKTQLANLYTYAQALIFPSFMEGFGLPGIEAMTIGTPVVCSNIPVFREIYDDACLMFNPKDSNDIAQKIKQVLENEKVRKELIAKGKKQVAKYSWRKMAIETLSIYDQANVS